VTEIFRSTIFHTPRNAFQESKALEYFEDGALAIENGRIVSIGDYSAVAQAHPDANVQDRRAGFILPGLIDTHIHFPQVRIIGGLGYSLLNWLEKLTLPEEAKLADEKYAAVIAKEFIAQLAGHGTTTALVFGAHFERATELLFEEADQVGVRVFSGLVLSDRNLRPELHQNIPEAYEASKRLIARFGDRYVLTPRFALSTTDAILDLCRALAAEHPGLRFTTHINENPREIEEVMRLFPREADYLAVYEKFELIGRKSVLAHNVHPTQEELERLACWKATIAHCPSSNAALGSGIFPMRRHLNAGVRFSLGTDVGGGTGFSLFKEALVAYQFQRVASNPISLTPVQLLYLATRAGAEALAIDGETGDFGIGKFADFIYIEPLEGGTLAAVLRESEGAERTLAAIITLVGPDDIDEVRVGGRILQ
jgi:guanine deaminase